jgi:hypothetical protein
MSRSMCNSFLAQRVVVILTKGRGIDRFRVTAVFGHWNKKYINAALSIRYRNLTSAYLAYCSFKRRFWILPTGSLGRADTKRTLLGHL